MVKTTSRGGIIVDENAYKKIKHKLIELNLSESMLCRILGIDKAFFSRVIRGLSNNERVREKIEVYLNIKIWN